MSDDSDKKPNRGRGSKPAGARAGFGAKKDVRPGGAKKPLAKHTGAGERPKRDFKSGGKPWQKRSDGPGGERSPSKDSAGGHPFRKREERPFEKRDGERKPFKPRDDRPAAADGERPKRDFHGKDRPRDGRPPEGGFGGGKKPFEKKPYGKKPSDGQARPGRFERGETDVARAGRPAGPFRDEARPPRKPFDKAAGAQGEAAASGRYDRTKRNFDDRKPKTGGFAPRPRPSDAPAETEGERIAKRLARAGIASRRDAEELIAAGRVRVNGRVLASPAFNVSPTDVIHLDDTEIPQAERTRLFLFHKPAGLVTTNRDPEGRKTVFDVLPAELPRLMTIGRLDINTEGLLLLTNDGGLSRVLELPATGWLRRYRVRVHGKVEEKALAGLADGIAVDGVFYSGIEASLERTQGSNAWLTIGLREGKNREVKNILGALGLDVTRLIRISYGPFQLGELPEGHVLEIKGRTLRDQLGERLIEEAGANFEADIATPFSNKPVRRTETRDDDPERPKFQRDGDRRPIGEGGLIKARKRRENSRDEALGKLSTKPERAKFERGEKPTRNAKFGERPDRFATFAPKPGAERSEPKPRGGKKEREHRPIEPPGQRRANVWMAPGARPQTKKVEGEDAGKPRGDRPSRSGGDRPRSKPGSPSKKR